MTVLFETWTVTIAHEWHKKFKEEHEGSTYTFASLQGCKDYVEANIELGKSNPDDRVLWYSIQGLQHIPCDESKPWGQTYQGMIYHEYEEVEK